MRHHHLDPDYRGLPLDFSDSDSEKTLTMESDDDKTTDMDISESDLASSGLAIPRMKFPSREPAALEPPALEDPVHQEAMMVPFVSGLSLLIERVKSNMFNSARLMLADAEQSTLSEEIIRVTNQYSTLEHHPAWIDRLTRGFRHPTLALTLSLAPHISENAWTSGGWVQQVLELVKRRKDNGVEEFGEQMLEREVMVMRKL
ncbi:Uu.00g078450.m01.CDS01 [Anthostomella pinea]|uniref:Uu.00g078450.m01.CDS01 n=1 Tax=Anthostomella pinea TaxID=933095 RepID=A0AAI8YGQ8_9PEZI|nr:Uu.00g078450.m01.CDS01 [Anthostomella pinea]